MKKIYGLILIVISMFNLVGCKKTDFSYFETRINNIEGYKYYVIDEVVYKESLVLYENRKEVYLYNHLFKINFYSKIINDMDSNDLYTFDESEYYVDSNVLYYYEGGEWKTKESSDLVGDLGLDINKKMFKSYNISTKNGKRIFEGKIKDDAVVDFFGYEVNGVNSLKLNINVNSNDYVTLISLSYVSDNGNNVSISIKPNYSYTLEFELPIIE